MAKKANVKEYLAPAGARCHKCGADLAGKPATHRTLVPHWDPDEVDDDDEDEEPREEYTCLECPGIRRGQFLRRLREAAHARGTVCVGAPRAYDGCMVFAGKAAYWQVDGQDYYQISPPSILDDAPLEDLDGCYNPRSLPALGDVLWAAIRQAAISDINLSPEVEAALLKWEQGA